MKTIALTVALALPATTLAADLEAPEARKSLGRFELKSLDGKRVRNKDLEGKVAVVSFWATWCKPCKQELDAFAALVKQNKGLTVLAIATDGPETQSAVRSTVRRKHWSLAPSTLASCRECHEDRVSAFKSGEEALAWAAKNMPSFINAADPDGSVGASLNPRGSVPFTMFVDKNGKVAYVHAGYRSGDESKYAEVIAALLAE
jgi:peroxiredoxin